MPSEPASDTREEDLVARLRRREDGAVARLVRDHQDRLYRLAHRLTGNHADADDLVQDTFMKAMAALPRFRGEASLSTWLHRIAVNLGINRLRAPAHARRDGRDAESVQPTAPSGTLGGLIGRERREAVRAAVADLPPRQREILVLHVYEEWTFPRIAETLGCPIGTAKANFFHAVANLKRRIGPAAPGGAESPGAQSTPHRAAPPRVGAAAGEERRS